MKNINRFIRTLLLLVILTTVSCSKNFLNTEVDTYATNQTIITDPSTLASFAYAFYTQLPWGFTALDNNLFGAASDEMQQSVVTNNTALFNSGAISPTFNPDGGVFKTFYDGIRAANFFLAYSANYYQFLSKNYDTVANALPFRALINDAVKFRAEAHVARAYYYSELIKRYGGVPIVTQTQLSVSPDSMYVGQQSYDSCVNYIVKEIDSNKNNLQVNWSTSDSANFDGRFSLGAALAIKARVLLYAASPLHNPTNDPNRWIRAINALNDLMNAPGLNLALDKSYAQYFNGILGQSGSNNYSLTSPETIFAVRANPNNSIEFLNYPPASVLAGSERPVCPTDNLVADYEYLRAPNPTNPYLYRDPRFTASIVYNGSTWTNRFINEQPGGSDVMTKTYSTKTGYYFKKFLTDNASTNQVYPHVWVLFRYGEVLLEYAEAVNEVYGPDVAPPGGTLTARQALMMVRNRASKALPSVASATSIPQFRLVVKHERRIELAFEDHRYWDLLRWGSPNGNAPDSINANVVLNGPIYGLKITTDPNTFNPIYTRVVVSQRVFHSPANYYYPFSYGDIVNSKNKLVQNPGY